MTVSDARAFLPLVNIGLALAGMAVVWRLVNSGQKLATDAIAGAQGATTNKLEQWFPLLNQNALITHAVWFPDGKQHAVPGESVDANGFFTLAGVRYRMFTDSQGRKFAHEE